MNEIDVSGLGRPTGAEKPLNPAVGRKDIRPTTAAPAQDTVELSDLPDLSSIESAVERGFETKTSELAGALSNQYPPLDTIDRVAAMLAGSLSSSTEQP